VFVDEQVRRRSPTVWLWAWFFTLEAGAFMAFFGFDALPFQDLPAHAGLIALRDRLALVTPESQYWVLAPHLGGYSLFRWLGHVLAIPLGPVGAVRLLAALPSALFPASFLFARRRLYGESNPAFAFSGLALSFGLMTLLGFASFLIALSLVIVGLVLWLELLVLAERPGVAPSEKRTLQAKVTFAAVVIVVAHGFAFILFLVLCAVTALVQAPRWPRLRQLLLVAPAFGLASWSTLVERSETVPAGSAPWLGHEPPIHFQGLLDKLSLLVTPTLMTRWGVDLAFSLFLWGWAAFALARAFTRPAASPHVRPLAVAAIVSLLLFAALPHSIHWFGFVDGRVVLLALMLGCLAVPRSSLSPRLIQIFDRAVPIGATVMVALVLAASFVFQKEARGYRQVLGDVPNGARLLNLPIEPNSHVFTAHPFVHYDKLILVERPLVASDVWFHQGSALYPTRRNPALTLPASYIESNLGAIDWSSYPLDPWDYVLVRLDPDDARPVVPARLLLVHHEGGWWLFRVGPVG
jgi:hypothetical protein